MIVWCSPSRCCQQTCTDEISNGLTLEGVAYLVIGGIILANSMPFIILHLRKWISTEETAVSVNANGTGEDLCFVITLMICATMFYFLNGIQMAFGQFLSSLSISQHGFLEEKAALLTGAAYGAFMLGRAVGIPLSLCLPASITIIGFLFICLLSVPGLFTCTLLGIKPLYLWVLGPTLGFGMSPMFATGLLWLEGHMIITGKRAGVLLVANSIGEMVIEVCLGCLFDKVGSVSFMYAVFIHMLGVAISFISMCLVVRKRKNFH